MNYVILVYAYNAGILAGIHPCGIITMIAELFGAESKAQVYGHLHAYLHDNEKATKFVKNHTACTCTSMYSVNNRCNML